jgi:hypothetical protein
VTARRVGSDSGGIESANVRLIFPTRSRKSAYSGPARGGVGQARGERPGRRPCKPLHLCMLREGRSGVP